MLLVGDQADFAEPLTSIGPYKAIDLTIPEPPEKVEIPKATPENLAQGRELLEQAVEWTGGGEAWASLRDLTQDGEMVISFQGQEIPLSLRTIRTSDDRDYVSQKLPFGEMVMVRLGEEGWKKTPEGVADLTREEIDGLIRDRSYELWGIFARAGELEAQAIGQGEIEGRDLDAILLSGSGLEKAFLYLEPGSGRPAALARSAKSITGVPVRQVEIFDDFRKVGPVMLPHSLKVLQDGEPHASGVVKHAVANEGVDEALFVKPEI
jgi:hypothetical protein